MVKWLVQRNFIGEDDKVKEFVAVLESCGNEVIGINVIPFSDEMNFVNFHTNEPLAYTIEDVKDAIPYGSTKLTKMTSTLGFKNCFFNDECFDMGWANDFRKDMLNSDMVICKVKDLKDYVDKNYNDPSEGIFIRPCKDLKAFNGTLTTIGQVSDWQNSVDSGSFAFDDDIEVCLSSPKNIVKEWRWFIISGIVVTGSLYKVNGQSIRLKETNEQEILKAQELALKWLPHSTCVMDVALVDGEYKVIEFNCFNSSGFYDHDLELLGNSMKSFILANNIIGIQPMTDNEGIIFKFSENYIG